MGDIEDAQRQQQFTYTAYDAATVRRMERPLLQAGVPLMRMAAQACADTVALAMDEYNVPLEESRVVVLAGAGDNGGDGLYAGALLAEQGATVTAIAVGTQVHERAYAALLRAGGSLLALDSDASIPGCETGFGAGEAGERLHTAITLSLDATVIIDAMTGIGAHGPLRGIAHTVAASLRNAIAQLEDDGDDLDPDEDLARPLVVAVDTPSGVGVDDGSVPGACIPADITVMFGALKPCAMLPPAAYACGTVALVDFGFDMDAVRPAVEAVNDALAAQWVRVPDRYDTKYSRGVVGVAAGSQDYPGAAVLCTRAAARSNVGMVRYVGPQRARDMVLAALPEAVMGKGRVQAWTVGSGVPNLEPDTTFDAQHEVIGALLAHYAEDADIDEHMDAPVDLAMTGLASGRTAVDAASVSVIDDGEPHGDDSGRMPRMHCDDMPPLCVDAGALDLLPERVPAHVVITPHAGELARLLARYGETVDTRDIAAEPWRWARRAHELTGATVLLKGAITIIVGPDDGDDTAVRTLIAGSAPAWLGTAGAGDVLAGMLGALLAQQDGDIERDHTLTPSIAAAAAYLHGLAASNASQSERCGWHAPHVYSEHDVLPWDERTRALGMPIVARDVIASIGDAFAQVLE